MNLMRQFLVVISLCTAGTVSLPAFAQQPVNDEPCGAIQLPVNAGLFCPTPLAFTTVGATNTTTPVVTCVGSIANDVWFKFTATAATMRVTWRVPVAQAGSTISNSVTAVYRSTDGTCNNLAQVGCNANPYVHDLTGLSIGSTYYIRIGAAGYSGNPGFTSFIGVGAPAPQPVNDECANAISLNDGALHGLYTDNATESKPASDCGWGLSENGALDAWYKFTATVSGQVTITGFKYTGTGVGQPEINLEQFASCGDAMGINCVDNDIFGPLALDINAVAGTTYYFRMYGRDKTGYMAIQASGNFPLPVGVSNLDARLSAGDKAVVSWNASNTLELRGFGIERMDDGGIFRDIGLVSLHSGEDKDNAYIFTFTDPEAVMSRTYYRIRQEQVNGAVSYSAIVSVTPARMGTGSLAIYPNPASDVLHIFLPEGKQQPLKAQIINSLGQLKKADIRNGMLDISYLPAGIYQLKVMNIDGHVISIVRFVKK